MVRIRVMLWACFLGCAGAGIGAAKEAASDTASHDKPKVIQEQVDALGSESYGYVHLGIPHPWSTPLTEKIVAHGNAAVPVLVRALKYDDFHVAGQAAFCLRLMKSDAGIGAAEARLKDLSQRTKLDLHARFAMVSLGNYVEDFHRKSNSAGQDSAKGNESSGR
jgi:hypothetical protein